MNIDFIIQETFPVEASIIYKAWLNSHEHTKMTGGKAECSSVINGRFTAWDGYITGVNISLIENQKIVQSWRTSEFKEIDNDSELTVEFEETNGGCVLTLKHGKIPEGQSDYEKGWIEHYFHPMKIYFAQM